MNGLSPISVQSSFTNQVVSFLEVAGVTPVSLGMATRRASRATCVTVSVSGSISDFKLQCC